MVLSSMAIASKVDSTETVTLATKIPSSLESSLLRVRLQWWLWSTGLHVSQSSQSSSWSVIDCIQVRILVWERWSLDSRESMVRRRLACRLLCTTQLWLVWFMSSMAPILANHRLREHLPSSHWLRLSDSEALPRSTRCRGVLFHGWCFSLDTDPHNRSCSSASYVFLYFPSLGFLWTRLDREPSAAISLVHVTFMAVFGRYSWEREQKDRTVTCTNITREPECLTDKWKQDHGYFLFPNLFIPEALFIRHLSSRSIWFCWVTNSDNSNFWSSLGILNKLQIYNKIPNIELIPFFLFSSYGQLKTLVQESEV
jgi:hypothetical protein